MLYSHVSKFAEVSVASYFLRCRFPETRVYTRGVGARWDHRMLAFWNGFNEHAACSVQCGF